MTEDQQTLKDNLAKAETHIAQVDEMIARQCKVIDQWTQHGWEPARALDFLASLERLKQVEIEHRDSLLKKVASSKTGAPDKTHDQ